tara:strand:+ start:8 stop:265 length:258 start_codon:yes stop_codon:yes gene_type:complete
MKPGDLVSVRTELRTARGVMHIDQIGIFMGYVNYPLGRMVKVLVSAAGENILGEHPEDKIIPVTDQSTMEWGKWKYTCTQRPVAL